MKKKLTAVTLFLASILATTGCNEDEVTLKKNAEGEYIIYSLNGENFTAENLLDELKDSSTARSTLYKEVSRKVFTYCYDNILKLDATEIEEDAKDDVDTFKSNAKSSAKEEGTDYDTYLENALEQQGVETLEELKQLYIDNAKKTEVLEDFVERNYEFFLDKYLATYTPFQVKHILVAANTADTNYKDGTMTADNARKLLQVIQRFQDGENFEGIADLTDDTSSKDNGGIMPFNQAQNYVAEFRFAPYILEMFGTSSTPADLYKKACDLHLVDLDSDGNPVSQTEWEGSELYETLNAVYGSGIKTVKIDDIRLLNNKVTKDDAGAYNYFDKNGVEKSGVTIPTVAEQTYEMNVDKYTCEGELNEKYYEEYELMRNQIFNATLNTHAVRYIEVPENWGDNNVATVGGKKVLADGKDGNPIFVVLASTGIHMMCSVHNAYATSAENNHKYFSLYNSDYSGIGTTVKGDYKDTYIGRNEAYNNYSSSNLSSNSDSLLSDITSYVSSAEYYLFNSLVYGDDALLASYTASYKAEFNGKIDIKFFDEGNELYDLVKDYIQDSIKSTDESFVSSVYSAAETYANKLARENEVKDSMANWQWKKYSV